MLDFWPPNTFMVFSQRNTLWYTIPAAHDTCTDDILKALGQQTGSALQKPSRPEPITASVGGTAVTPPPRASSSQVHSLPSLWFPGVSGVQNCALIKGGVICKQLHQPIFLLLFPEEELRMRVEVGSASPLPWPDTECKDQTAGEGL